jgi:hypothetical protein
MTSLPLQAYRQEADAICDSKLTTESINNTGIDSARVLNHSVEILTREYSFSDVMFCRAPLLTTADDEWTPALYGNFRACKSEYSPNEIILMLLQMAYTRHKVRFT